MTTRILIGDCRERLRDLPNASVDSVVCDPPYHLTSIVKRFGAANAAPAKVGATGAYARASKGFMGQTWDGGDVAFQPETWAEVLRVLKPGGHLVAFSGTRTYHRMAVAIEDAGFEIRDQLGWLYGSGFPKSHDVAKGIAKQRTEDIEPIRVVCRFIRAAMDAKCVRSHQLVGHFGDCHPRLVDHWAARDTDSQPALPTNEQYAVLRDVLNLGHDMDAEVKRLNARKGEHGDDWKSALVIGTHEGDPGGLGGDRFTVRDNLVREIKSEWEGWGTALKPAWEPICLARKPLDGTVAANVLKHGTGAINIDGCRIETNDDLVAGTGAIPCRHDPSVPRGRGGEASAARRYSQSGSTDFAATPGPRGGDPLGRWPANIIHDGSEEVLAGFPETDGVVGALHDPNGSLGYHGGAGGAYRKGTADSGSAARFFYCAKATTEERGEGNNHPTVKPISLMRWLVRLVTPKGGLVLDPFMGSGSTALACDAEQFNFIGCELSADYAAIAERRIRDAAGMFADISVEHAGPSSRAAA